MKNCLTCQKEYQNKRESSKFCSANCRVKHFQKYSKGKNTVTPVQMQVLYNAILEALGQIKLMPAQTQYDGPKSGDSFKSRETVPLSLSSAQLPRVAVEAIKRKYVEERRDCSCDEEYLNWVERLESDDRLFPKDKQDVKSTH